jgi:CxxC motif-containing protein (DUF1111 family)
MKHLALLLAACMSLFAAGEPEAADRLEVTVGRSLFERNWVPAPASTRATDGLGPLFNARSCAGCHPGGGGATLAIEPGEVPRGLVLRLPGNSAYGRQLQTGGAPGQMVEGRPRVTYTDLSVAIADATAVLLRRPWLGIAEPAFGVPPSHLSPRLAPSLRGIGLLAAVPASAIAARADPDDRDGDGIRGRVGIGRFGLRAEQPDLREQVAEALLLDLGLSTPLRPEPAGDCSAAQAACRSAPQGDDVGRPGVEVGDEILDSLVAYLVSLPPPRARKHGDDTTGASLFGALGCGACHVPTLAGAAAYSDLLLHDLGPELADQGDAADPEARLWRTAPLWGFRGTTALLHDGRARDAQEAILWHGGEAAAARERFRALDADGRAQLLSFLAGL